MAMSEQVYLKVGFSQSKLMVRFMVTKWGERVESERDGLQQQCPLHYKVKVLRGDATLTLNDHESLTPS